MSKIKQALILAAGFGTRLKPITNTQPKALVKIAGHPMLGTIIRQLLNCNIDKIIVNTHYFADQIENYLNKEFNSQVLVSYEKEILETGGGLLNVFTNFSNEDTLVVGCDALMAHKTPFTNIIDAWQPDRMESLIYLKPAQFMNTARDFSLSPTQQISYRTDNAKYTYIGVGIYARSFFKQSEISKFSLADNLKKTQHVNLPYFGIEFEHDWIDIGSVEALKYASEHYSEVITEINKTAKQAA